jgi:hypothetical protein
MSADAAGAQSYPSTCAGLYQSLLALRSDLTAYENVLGAGATDQHISWNWVKADFATVASNVDRSACDAATRFLWEWLAIGYTVDDIGRRGAASTWYPLDVLVTLNISGFLSRWNLDDATTRHLQAYGRRIRAYYVRDGLTMKPGVDAVLRRIEAL